MHQRIIGLPGGIDRNDPGGRERHLHRQIGVDGAIGVIIETLEICDCIRLGRKSTFCFCIRPIGISDTGLISCNIGESQGDLNLVDDPKNRNQIIQRVVHSVCVPNSAWPIIVIGFQFLIHVALAVQAVELHIIDDALRSAVHHDKPQTIGHVQAKIRLWIPGGRHIEWSGQRGAYPRERAISVIHRIRYEIGVGIKGDLERGRNQTRRRTLRIWESCPVIINGQEHGISDGVVGNRTQFIGQNHGERIGSYNVNLPGVIIGV